MKRMEFGVEMQLAVSVGSGQSQSQFTVVSRSLQLAVSVFNRQWFVAVFSNQ